MVIDTTLNNGTKSGTEVSSFNISLMCVSFFMFHVEHKKNVRYIFIFTVLFVFTSFLILLNDSTMFHVKHIL